MIPEEKALELFNKMYNVDAYDDYNDPVMQYSHAKKCALIAVDEIMKISTLGRSHNRDESQYDYWQEVKQEIINL